MPSIDFSNGFIALGDRRSIAVVQRECPPHDLQVERALLGAVLYDNTVHAQLGPTVDAADFFDELHRRLWAAILSQLEAGRPAAPLLLPGLDEAERRYAGKLVVDVPTTINAHNYAEIVRELAARRRLAEIGQQLIDEAHNRELAVTDIARATAADIDLARARAASAGSDRYVSRRLSDIEAAPVSWLWQGRFPLGKISILAGDPGVGKSQLTCAFAAAVTTGATWPDGTQAPRGSVVFICCEDDAGDTLRPRLEAAGADARRIHILDWTVDDNGTRRHFDVGRGIAGLSKQVADVGDVKLIVIDPISAYMGWADSHVVADVRQALAPLQSMAAALGPAVLLISHLNKANAATAMNRVSGSGAFVAVSRSACLVGFDPADDTKRRRVLVPLKNNLCSDRGGLAYRITPVTVAGVATSKVEFEPGTVHVSADELLRPASPRSEAGALNQAIEFLRAELADGPKSSRDIEAAARDADVSKASLTRARKALGVEPKRARDGKWYMRLVTRPGTPEGDQGNQVEHPDRGA